MVSNKKIKGLNIIKRVSMLFVSVCILLGNIMSYGDIVLAAVYESEEVVIETKEIVKNGTAIFNGQVREEAEISDLHNGIIRLLNEETMVVDSLLYGNNVYSNDTSVFSNSYIQINVNKANLANIIVAEEDITINASEISSDEHTIVYSKTGNINFNVGKMNFNGIVYAPQGKVSFSASNVLVEGFVCASKVDIAAGIFQINGKEEHSNVVEKLNFLSNDIVLEISCMYSNENGSYNITVDTGNEDKFEELIVYARYNNEDKFEKICELELFEEEGLSDTYNKVDLVVKGETRYNEIIYSNVRSFCINNGIVKYAKYDTDEDGITDGEEILITKTAPDSKDTDGDGINDNVECFYLLTDPLKVTEDADFDDDGMSNFSELSVGTNPYLADCDADELLDGEDKEPLVPDAEISEELFNNVYVAVGKYDRVINGYGEDGYIYEYIYNYITGDIKYIRENNKEIYYYYDATGNQIVDIRKYNDEWRINSNKYDENGNILAHSNNACVYSYEYDEFYSLTSADINGQNIITQTGNELIYGNGDIFATKDNENGSIFYLNGKCKSEINYNKSTDEEKYYISEVDLLYTYKYVDGVLTSITSNDGYEVKYVSDDEKYEVEYKYGDEIKRQVIDVNSHDIRTDLISGAVYNKKSIDSNITKQTIYNGEQQCLETQYAIIDKNIAEIVYNEDEKLVYKYNDSGQITDVYRNDEHVLGYEYNLLGQLVGVIDLARNTRENYTYDIYNNIQQVDVYTFTGENEQLTETQKYYYGTDFNSDILIEYNGERISYDEIGNPLKYYDGKNFQWSGRILEGVVTEDAEIKYLYDKNGMRVAKNINGNQIKYYFDGNDILLEKSDEHLIWYIYDNTTGLLGFSYNEENYYYIKNTTNDVIAIIDDSGDFVCGYTYDAWGKITNIDGNQEIANINPFRYKSYYYDSETGFYYLQSRYYDPELRRFISMDDVCLMAYKTADSNLYAYCGNDPINLYDPEGTEHINVSIFSINEFDSVTRNYLMDDFEDEWLGVVEFDYVNSDSRDDFIKWWNSLNGQDIAFIRSHGTPTSIGTGSSIIYNSHSNAASLDKVDVKMLVLSGCNCGHWNYWYNGIARVFARKITGVVLADDGTTHWEAVNWLIYKTISFTSMKDSVFTKYAGSDRDNYGWILYSGKTDAKKILNIYELTVDGIYKLYCNKSIISFK